MNNEYLDENQTQESEKMPEPSPNDNKKKDDSAKTKKTIIISVAIVVLLAVIISVVVIVISKNKKEEAAAPSTPSSSLEDSEYTAIVTKTQPVTNANGEAVTDADGNIVTEAITNADGTAVTEVVLPTFPSVSNPNPLNEGTKTEDTKLLDEAVKPIFESKNFTMTIVTTVEGTPVPMTICVNDKNVAFRVSMKSILAAGASEEEMGAIAGLVGDEMRLVVKDGTSYSLFEMFGQKYYVEGEDMLGMDTDSLTNPIGKDLTYVQTSTVKDGSKTYTCEEYKTSDGSVQKYYFIGKNLARIETIDGDTTAVMEISELRKGAESALFSLSGYKEFNESSLAGMLGGL